MPMLFSWPNAYGQDAVGYKGMAKRWNKYGDAYLSTLSADLRHSVITSTPEYKKSETKLQKKIRNASLMSAAVRDSILISKVVKSGNHQRAELGNRLGIVETKVGNDLFESKPLSERDQELLEIFKGQPIYVVTLKNRTKKGDLINDKKVVILKKTMDEIWVVNYLRAQ